MNLRVAANAAMLFVTLAFITYGTSGWINASLGLTETTVGGLLSDVWKLIAIAIAVSIATGYAWPKVRGVRRGDTLMTFVRRHHQTPMGIATFNEPLFVTALENGRTNAKIRVQLQNGSLAEGIIEEYAGTISPPSIRLTETENAGAGEAEVRFNGGSGGNNGSGGNGGNNIKKGKHNNYGEKE
jgi:hypothetical protein